MKQSRAVLSLWAVLVAASAACGGALTGFRFHTQALYTAPVSGYDIAIDATGRVEAGDDLSSEAEAEVTITPVGTGAGYSPQVINVAYNTDNIFVVKDWPDSQASLDEVIPIVLNQAGIQNPSQAEVEETAKVIRGVLSGSKGTYMDGQTKSLIVKNVHFSYP